MSRLNRLNIEAHTTGAMFAIRVHAAARRNSLDGIHDGALRISVTAAPEKGRANRAIQELLSTTIGVPRTSVEIVSGATSKLKRVLVAQIEPGELEQRILDRIGT